jgi:hypothetical protein
MYEAVSIEWHRYFNFSYWKYNFTAEGTPEKYDLFLEDLMYYFQKQKEDWAFLDYYEYPNLYPTEFDAPEVRAQYFYEHNKPKGYKVDFPSP